MKNTLILTATVMILTACNSVSSMVDNNTENSPTPTPAVMITEVNNTLTKDTGFLPSYSSWVKREFPPTGNFTEQTEGAVDLDLAFQIADEVYSTIEWKDHTSEQAWYWKTSTETETDGNGNCSDHAILTFMKWREAGFPDANIGMVHMDNKAQGTAHMCPCIMINCKIYIYNPEPLTQWRLVQVFNLLGNWKF